MSSRWYPIYRRGNPQLRVFLPNFWMKIVRPEVELPPNMVQFKTSVQMTNYDIKNYLEKIYKVPVAEVRSEIMEGEFKKVPFKGYVIKDDDYRRAFVTLLKEHTFKFPDIYTEREKVFDEDYKKVQDQASEGYKTFDERAKKRPGMPGWFTV